jgi:hypothetical protein
LARQFTGRRQPVQEELPTERTQQTFFAADTPPRFLSDIEKVAGDRN